MINTTLLYGLPFMYHTHMHAHTHTHTHTHSQHAVDVKGSPVLEGPPSCQHQPHGELKYFYTSKAEKS